MGISDDQTLSILQEETEVTEKRVDQAGHGIGTLGFLGCHW